MRLENIKLSGFKSFADPTTIHFHSNLTGIVGPNGCGKSNIIDAVRWVMGEISAKQLRSESMGDIIFNGSAGRKAVGVAAIELLFDNSDASLGGEYAAYQEICIRREVNRDGFSDYFLNNTRCRRKDITEIFLGTGLGPRSYAIIEQGMIVELIDAKPEELRSLIEEPAGIAKYKEKRRETENRIKHTKENLSRLNDIVEELNNQLKHLRTQANAANRYKTLKQKERTIKAELQALHWQDLKKQTEILQNHIATEEINLENKTTELHTLEAKTSVLREKLSGETSALNEIQTNYYRLGSNIARLEEQIHSSKDRRIALNKDLAQIDDVWREAITHKEHDNEQIKLFDTQIAKLTLEFAAALKNANDIKNELLVHEHTLKTWQLEWDNFNNNIVKLNQQHEVESTRIQHIQQTIANEKQTIAKLKTELDKLDFKQLTTEFDVLNTTYNKTKIDYETTHHNLTQKQQQIIQYREITNKLASDLNNTNNKLQALIGKRSSLEALQQNALGKNNANLNNWLTQHKLIKKARLAERIKAVSGWETAIEIVLSSYLDAVCVENFDDNLFSILKTLSQGNLSLVNLKPTSQQFIATNNIPTLASKITTTLPISYLLKDIYVAETLDEAMQLRQKLEVHESIITKQGVWIGPNWIRATFDPNQKTGVIQREQDIAALNEAINKEQEISNSIEKTLQENRYLLTNFENDSNTLQQELRIVTNKYTEAQKQLGSIQTNIEHLHKREEQFLSEIKHHEQILTTTNEQLQNVKTAWESASHQKNSLDERNKILTNERDQLNNKLVLLREHTTKAQTQADAFDMQLKLTKTQQEYLKQNLDRNEKRLISLDNHRKNIISSLQEIDIPIVALENDLQVELKKRLTIEQNLTTAKQQVNATEAVIQELEQNNKIHQETAAQIRAALEKLRVTYHGLATKAQIHLEQINELNLQLDTLIAMLPTTATIEAHEQELQTLATKIERMGPINLAAIDECTKLEERKNYLDMQYQDLLTALNTLESAIRKIDQDTKTRFQETFEKINHTFQELFPKIFNGGKAALKFTSDDLLETGVIITAQPPGKCNTNIHALSGGEKSLTAIALIFAIFRLNPAPFCMLDEVDAALDDVNTLRFCNLLKEMAPFVQFIFISHNKQTIEIASHLSGVTMQEPGVSRIVSVDVQAAVDMVGDAGTKT